MVEVKKAFRAGRLDSPAQVAAWTNQGSAAQPAPCEESMKVEI